MLQPLRQRTQKLAAGAERVKAFPCKMYHSVEKGAEVVFALLE